MLLDEIGSRLFERDQCVLGLNQVDKIQPGRWNEKANIPSKDQEESINIRLEDISRKICDVCSIPKERIIPYSALRRYRLENLFNAMLDACPHKREWVLYDRKAIADFEELIDQNLLIKIKQSLDVNQEGGG